MKYTKQLFFIFCALLMLPLFLAAQDRYATVDSSVQKLGPMTGYNLATITEKLTAPYSNKEMKARAIFTWIALHIALDPKAVRSLDNKNVEPENVIASRKTTSLGFSLLFQEMCSQANIRCLSVDGYLKISTEDIDEILDAAAFSWNVIQLGTSPNEWYYVDASQASGYLDSKKTNFTRNFSPQYFFADKTTFNLEHFPDNQAWFLGEGYPSIKTFYSLPLIKPAAYKCRLSHPQPLIGKIMAKPSIPFTFSFQLKNAPDNPQFAVILGEGIKKQLPQRVNIRQEGVTYSFDFTFKKEDTYPVTICLNDQPILTYLAEVSE